MRERESGKNLERKALGASIAHSMSEFAEICGVYDWVFGYVRTNKVNLTTQKMFTIFSRQSQTEYFRFLHHEKKNQENKVGSLGYIRHWEKLGLVYFHFTSMQ